jgi:hypothetical protein
MGILGLKFGSDSTSNTNSNTQNYDQKQYNTNTFDSNNTTTFNTVTDGGAIKAIGDVAALVLNNGVTQVQSGYDYGAHIFDAATEYANSVNNSAVSAFDTAADMTHDALTTATKAYADASKAQAVAQGATAAAYADAKGTTDSQKQIILGVLAVAGLMALGMMQRKA